MITYGTTFFRHSVIFIIFQTQSPVYFCFSVSFEFSHPYRFHMVFSALINPIICYHSTIAMEYWTHVYISFHTSSCNRSTPFPTSLVRETEFTFRKCYIRTLCCVCKSHDQILLLNFNLPYKSPHTSRYRTRPFIIQCIVYLKDCISKGLHISRIVYFKDRIS